MISIHEYFNGYQEETKRTQPAKPKADQLLNAALGICGEGGEVADLIKKNIAHGHPLDIDEIGKELGDELWYIQELCTLLGLNMEEVAKANIEKLKRRYPEGFSEERSIHRED